MNQTELNQVALSAISNHISQVASKMRKTLVHDLQKRSEQISGAALHHIHNMALYHCLVWLNSVIVLNDASEDEIREYNRLAATLEPKFKEITEALKDFEPAK